MVRRRLSFMLLMSLLLGGCAGLYNPGGEWPGVGINFVQSMRWRDYSGAAIQVAEDQRGAFLARTSELEQLQPVDGQLESFVLRDKDQRADAVAVLDYYRLPSTVVRRWKIVQEWEYQGAGWLTPGTWQLVSPLPALPE